MGLLAASFPLFAIVVAVVCCAGIVAGIVARARRHDPFSREPGGLAIFHGEPDAGPHQAPGAREHDRHVIDPPAD